ncbi:MAG: alkaline phosphatase family protein [Candidatus Tumulicola sp.]
MQRISVVLIAALLTACSARYSQSGVIPAPATASHNHATTYPITHIVIIMQENRSFDNFFRGFPKANSATFGYGHGVKYTLQPLHLAFLHDINHYRWQFLEDYDGGKNDGFDQQIRMLNQPPPNGTCKYSDPWNHPACWLFWTGKSYMQMPFSYVIKSEIQSYWTMASQYTLGDHNFASTDGPSFGPHQMLIAGQDGHADEVPSTMPWGCDAPKETENYLVYGQAKPPEFPAKFGHDVLGSDPCFTYDTAANLLDKAKVSWRWYVQPRYLNGQIQDSYWLDAFDAIKAVRYGPDFANVVTPDTQVLNDIADGKLAAVSWVMPHGGASDHAGGGSGACGPAWVTSIVNAIGQSSYWKSTAIVITWDEWGGWFDHVVPPQYADPVTGAYEGLGYRTPLIVVSPYAKNHYVSKAQHETASALHFVEKIFGLPSLGLADKRADAYDDIFDFSKHPTTFKKIPSNGGTQCSGDQSHAPPETDY